MDIQLFQPAFDVEACLAEIRECLEKGWTGMGFKTAKFEELWKNYTGLNNAYFLNSATAGLNMTFEILKRENGWQDGDEVITASFTFISTNHAILLAGLTPVFADIDEYLCLDPLEVEKRITAKTKAVCFVGFGGSTGQYDKIVSICKKRNLKLILDAAHLAGTRLNGEIPGKEADAIIYSFQAVKNLPTADSGMLCFADNNYDAIARKLGWLGIDKDTFSRSSNLGNYKWKYDVKYVGNKYHGNSIMASIAIAQLNRLDQDNAYRRQISKWYEESLAKYSDKIRLIPIPDNCESSRHLFQIIVEKRDALLEHLNTRKIFPGVHYTPNTEYEMYSQGKGSCPKSEYAGEHIISLPIHLRLRYADIQEVIGAIVEFIRG